MFVGMDEVYTPPAGIDDYHCFVLDPHLANDSWVMALEVAPGNTKIVHHVILFTDPNDHSPALDAAEPGPGYTCFGDPGFIDTTLLGGWVPGTSRVETPAGTGMPISRGRARSSCRCTTTRRTIRAVRTRRSWASTSRTIP